MKTASEIAKIIYDRVLDGADGDDTYMGKIYRVVCTREITRILVNEGIKDAEPERATSGKRRARAGKPIPISSGRNTGTGKPTFTRRPKR